jgi:hypothetical protein
LRARAPALLLAENYFIVFGAVFGILFTPLSEGSASDPTCAMKRCPKCEFIYLDQDEVCDLDGTPLITADDSELTNPQSLPQPAKAAGASKRKLAYGVAAAAMAGALVSSVYLGVTGKFSRKQNQQTAAVTQEVPQPALATATATPSPSVMPSPSPEESPAANVRASAAPSAEAPRAVVSRNPVSTGSETAGKNKVRIRLTNGTVVEAEEVWRTRQGVWYRRNGIVTLLESSRVKAIERSKATAKASR